MGSTSFSNKIVGIFRDRLEIDNVLTELNNQGFKKRDISVLARKVEPEKVRTHSGTTYADPEMGTLHLRNKDSIYSEGQSGRHIYPTGSLESGLYTPTEKVYEHDRVVGSGNPEVNDIHRTESDYLEERNKLSEGSFDQDHKVSDKDPKGMVKGATVGGALGLLGGLGMLMIPGVGPILAAGPLAGAITAALGGAAVGTATGTIIGVLNDEGIPSEKAEFYNRHFNKGDVLVVIHTENKRIDEAVRLLRKYNPDIIDTF